MGNFFPAANIGRDQVNPLQEFGQALAIKTGLQQAEAATLENQQRVIALRQTQALNDAFANAVQPDPATGKATFNQDSVVNALASKGAGALIPQVTQSFLNMDKLRGDVLAQNDAHAKAVNDYMAAALQPIIASKDASGNYDPTVVGGVLAHIATVYPQEAAQLKSQLVANPGKLNQIIDGVVNSSAQQQQIANERTTSQAKLLQAQTEAGIAPSTIAKNVAQTAEAQKNTEIAGQVTPAIKYEQQQANYRAGIARQAQFANTLQKDGLDKLNTIFADPQHGYTQFLAQAAATKDTIMQSKNGSELASSLVPLMTALGVTSFAGVHRINTTEINAAGPQAGSAFRRINNILDKYGSGSIPDDVLKETTGIIDGLISAKHAGVIGDAKMIAANTGLDTAKVTVMDRDGNTDSLANQIKASSQPVQSAPSVPANVARLLSKAGPGIHTLTDGTVWKKDTDGTITKQ